MNFWERVDDLLDRNDINKKTLAYEAGFDASNITKGIKNNNIPSAETAVKIAQVLGVSVEYLVNGTETTKSPSQKETEQKQLRLYRKYHDLIEKMESFSEEKQTVVNNLVKDLEKI
ncbi:MAG: helix-turn-helix transcriptional regulator [Spirochaetaceae bacterium]|nr:helix-turn-helix transcriptional regulator [Spirochaetaceae bacterium]